MIVFFFYQFSVGVVIPLSGILTTLSVVIFATGFIQFKKQQYCRKVYFVLKYSRHFEPHAWEKMAIGTQIKKCATNNPTEQKEGGK